MLNAVVHIKCIGQWLSCSGCSLRVGFYYSNFLQCQAFVVSFAYSMCPGNRYHLDSVLQWIIFFLADGFTNFCSLVHGTNKCYKLCLEQVSMLPGDSCAELMTLQQGKVQERMLGPQCPLWGPGYQHICQNLLFTQKSERFYPSVFSISGSWTGAVTSQTTSLLNIHIWRWQLDSLHKSTWSSLITRLKSTPWHHWCFLTLIFRSCDSSQL